MRAPVRGSQYLGEVEGVEGGRLRLLVGHYLEVHGPRGRVVVSCREKARWR
jgi:hypothetical protein